MLDLLRNAKRGDAAEQPDSARQRCNLWRKHSTTVIKTVKQPRTTYLQAIEDHANLYAGIWHLLETTQLQQQHKSSCDEVDDAQGHHDVDEDLGDGVRCAQR